MIYDKTLFHLSQKVFWVDLVEMGIPHQDKWAGTSPAAPNAQEPQSSSSLRYQNHLNKSF